MEIGCFSKEAYQFIDRLKAAGQSYWQITSVAGPTGYGDSPYQSFSTFAGNPYFIDLETLTGEGLLTAQECEYGCEGIREDKIDYEKIYKTRFQILEKAFSRFGENDEYRAFVSENQFWLEDYSLYMAIKDRNGGVSWNEWEKRLKTKSHRRLKMQKQSCRVRLPFYKFQQYEFDRQWKRLALLCERKRHRDYRRYSDLCCVYRRRYMVAPEIVPVLMTLLNRSMLRDVRRMDFRRQDQLWENPL